MARDRVTFDDLLAIARRVNVEVIAAPSSHRGTKGFMGTVVGVTLHHTGTPNSLKPDQDYLDYEVVKEGRAGLKNSLSAFGLGRWRAIYVFSECLSWHAGEWLFAGIVDGNGHFLGIEAAGVGDWTPFQLDVYPRLVASALLFLGEGVDMMPRHADGAMPRGRKDDARNLPADFRATVQHYLDHPELIPVGASPAVDTPEEEEDESMKHIAVIGIKGVGWFQANLLTREYKDIPSAAQQTIYAQVAGQVHGDQGWAILADFVKIPVKQQWASPAPAPTPA